MKGLVIGCGGLHPPRDWDCLDARDLGCNRYVQDAANLSNIITGTYERVVARDVIEHLPWRHVPAVLGEWLRVVEVGGTLDVETPNAAALAEMLTNPNNPALYSHGREPDWQRFCRTAFGHQDYPQNAHLAYFTPEWLRELLLEAGASQVRTVTEDLNRFQLEATK